MQHLQIGTTLQSGKYKIISVLGQGGFGITYLAEQVMLGRKVCIKEFFFKDCCDRDESTSHVTLGTQANKETVQRFLNKFLKEARTISQLDHPNIIKIHDIFEENNTAYYVMDYVEGENLSELVKRQGALSEVTAVQYICKVANALKYIHAKSINHLDVKPGNIMLRKNDGEIVLIDFGLAKQYDDAGSQTSSTPVGISQGYAPIEQYRAGGVAQFSPQTDIYSLGATLYWLILGKTPPAADEILDEGLPALPSYTSAPVQNAIKAAMQARKKDRPENVGKWMGILLSSNVSGFQRPSNYVSSSNAKNTTSEETLVIGAKTQEPKLASEPVAFDLTSYRITPSKLSNPKDVENSAKSGNGEDRFVLAIMYLRGEGKSQNISKSYELLVKSKNAGDPRAISILKNWSIVKAKYEKTAESQSRQETSSTTTTSSTNSTKTANSSSTIQNRSSFSMRSSITLWLVIGIVSIIIVIILCRKNFYGNSISNDDAPIEIQSDTMLYRYISDSDGDYYWTGGAIQQKDSTAYEGENSYVLVPNGHGKAEFRSNDPFGRKEYNGQMEYGYRKGEGTLTYKNGDYFEGTFNNNNFESGTFYSFASGEYFEGSFSNNQPYNGSWYNKEGKVIQNVVNGK